MLNNITKADGNLMESRQVIGFVGGCGSSSSSSSSSSISCGIASSTAPAASAGGGTKTNLLHFNTTSTSTSTSSSAPHTLFFGSSPEEEGMSNGRGPAFTLVQREELERQTMIFKYMMASVPVPPHLLLPLTKNQRNCISSSSGGGATDSEPWRCRRTDGKKWRCSRDVAPHQKYCERHSHKNRPRSRKPVESSSSSLNTTRLQQISNSRNNNTSVTAVTSAVTCHQDSSHHHYLPLNTQQQNQKDISHASAPPSPRCLEWFTRGEVIAVPNSDQDWHHQHTKDLYHLKHHSHVPTLSPYPDQAQSETLNDQCSLLLGLPSSLEGASNNDNNDKDGPCSSLSLAVFSDHVTQDREGKLICNDEDGSSGKTGGELKPHWMSSGGPLAEALCLGSTALGKSGPTDG